MAKVELLAPFIKKWEGGFVNDPIDRGGATNKGITLRTFIHYRKLKGLPTPSIEDLKNISDEEWMDVLKTIFWDRWQADKISNQSIANILVDWVWASGVHGIKIPQTTLGVKADGIVGKNTLAALNVFPSEKLFNLIFQSRVDFINGIVNRSVAAYEKKIGRKATEKELLANTQKRFLNGWLNRLNSIKFTEQWEKYS